MALNWVDSLSWLRTTIRHSSRRKTPIILNSHILVLFLLVIRIVKFRFVFVGLVERSPLFDHIPNRVLPTGILLYALHPRQPRIISTRLLQLFLIHPQLLTEPRSLPSSRL
ncbi:hypothetical protein RND81_02G216200 [Saponaria officinalis]|uniref:Uncharacterized protein n=1 Tax=Saponaria officinalis TaxID=3572 RepID=A0AAW1MWQ6_SAPOF